MDEGLAQAIALGLARDGTKLLGGYLIAQHMATGSQVDSIAGGILALVGIGFSIYDKYHVKAILAKP